MGTHGDKRVIRYALSEWVYSHDIILIMEEWIIEGHKSLGLLNYEGEAIVKATCIWVAVDRGIGSYEYHGSKGVHEDWTTELKDVILNSAILYDDATQEETPVDLKDPANKPLVEYWLNYISENATNDD